MTMPFRWLALASTLVLAACARPEPAETSGPAASPESSAAPAPVSPLPGGSAGAATAAPGSVLALDGEGLRLFDVETGAARALPFGTPMDRTLAVLTALRGGPAEQGVNEDCAATFATWDGLTAWFDGDRFVGWSARRPEAGIPLTTASGLGVGSTRGELVSAYAAEISPSTLGKEFSAGGLSGLLDSAAPDARVTDLWAGTTCLFR